MRLEHTPEYPGGHIVISRRNLLALLAKLETEPDSARTITAEDENGVTFAVTAEHDLAHSAGRGFPPGRMHPHTERVVRVATHDT